LGFRALYSSDDEKSCVQTTKRGRGPIEQYSGPGSIVRELADRVAIHGPFKIGEVDYPDPVVTLAGDNWSLSMLCPWKLLHHGSVVVDPDNMTESGETATEIVTDAVWELVGHSIIEVRQSKSNQNDPTFILTGEYSIEVAADTDLDPWVMSVPGITFVGTMSSPA